MMNELEELVNRLDLEAGCGNKMAKMVAREIEENKDFACKVSGYMENLFFGWQTVFDESLINNLYKLYADLLD